MKTRRQRRVAELIQRELGDIIERELSDPRLAFISVTWVEMSSDLLSARVYISQFGNEEQRDQVLPALQHASGWLRHELAERTRLRYIPKLDFRWDTALIEAQRIDTILDQLQHQEEEELET